MNEWIVVLGNSKVFVPNATALGMHSSEIEWKIETTIIMAQHNRKRLILPSTSKRIGNDFVFCVRTLPESGCLSTCSWRKSLAVLKIELFIPNRKVVLVSAHLKNERCLNPLWIISMEIFLSFNFGIPWTAITIDGIPNSWMLCALRTTPGNAMRCEAVIPSWLLCFFMKLFQEDFKFVFTVVPRLGFNKMKNYFWWILLWKIRSFNRIWQKHWFI